MVPPFVAGAVQVSDTCVFPAVPTTLVGATVGPTGLIHIDCVDTGPVPAGLTAETL